MGWIYLQYVQTQMLYVRGNIQLTHLILKIHNENNGGVHELCYEAHNT